MGTTLPQQKASQRAAKRLLRDFQGTRPPAIESPSGPDNLEAIAWIIAVQEAATSICTEFSK